MTTSSEADAHPSEQPKLSKKAAKKEEAKLEKLRRRLEASSAVSGAAEEEEVGEPYTEVGALGEGMQGRSVLVRGRAQAIRAVGKKMAFVVVRERGFTVQCVVTEQEGSVSRQMVKFVTSLNRESIVDVRGTLTVPSSPIKGASQQVEIQVHKLHCVSKAFPTLPINLEDAARSEAEIEKALQAGEQLVRVNQDTRLNFRVLDIRTPANQGIFGIQSQVGNEDMAQNVRELYDAWGESIVEMGKSSNFLRQDADAVAVLHSAAKIFRQFLLSEGFIEIHTPKLIAGSSEGGSAVFKLDYKGRPACLAQSPQLHKQMSICGDFGRVFEIGPVFRAEDSYTHRHLCEFTGLDVEMEIKKHYLRWDWVLLHLFCASIQFGEPDFYVQVMDIVDQLFVAMFDSLNASCKKELEAIGRQYPFEPLKDAGVEIDPLGDLNTEVERKLGQLVLEKYGTEFYILHRYPLAVRPFYTMPCYDNPAYSNSFDVFIRGKEIISGAQRVHVPEFLTKRAEACGIDVKTIETYIDSFRYGAPPHGGFGVGVERVVMLFCGLNNIRKTSLFPRDPLRISP